MAERPAHRTRKTEIQFPGEAPFAVPKVMWAAQQVTGTDLAAVEVLVLRDRTAIGSILSVLVTAVTGYALISREFRLGTPAAVVVIAILNLRREVKVVEEAMSLGNPEKRVMMGLVAADAAAMLVEVALSSFAIGDPLAVWLLACDKPLQVKESRHEAACCCACPDSRFLRCW